MSISLLCDCIHLHSAHGHKLYIIELSFVQTLFIQTRVLQDIGQHGNPKRVFFLDREARPTLLTEIKVHLCLRKNLFGNVFRYFSVKFAIVYHRCTRCNVSKVANVVKH